MIEFKFLKNEEGIKDQNELIEFEKKLYLSFSTDEWIMTNYIIENNERIRPPIPYEDVFIFIAKKDNEIIAGISGSLNMNNTLQLEKLGFKIDKKQKICEGLNFYINKSIGEGIMSIVGNFLDQIVIELKKRGIDYIYSTCSKELKSLYLLFGFDIIESLLIHDKEEFLIRLSL